MVCLPDSQHIPKQLRIYSLSVGSKKDISIFSRFVCGWYSVNDLYPTYTRLTSFMLEKTIVYCKSWWQIPWGGCDTFMYIAVLLILNWRACHSDMNFSCISMDRCSVLGIDARIQAADRNYLQISSLAVLVCLVLRDTSIAFSIEDDFHVSNWLTL